MSMPVLRTAVVLSMLALNACDVSSDPSSPLPVPATVVEVQGVRLTPQSFVLAGVGDTRRLTAIIAPLDATDRSVIWESTDSTIAAVNGGGLVTAKSPGAGVFITAYSHDRSHQASVVVTVLP